MSYHGYGDRPYFPRYGAQDPPPPPRKVAGLPRFIMKQGVTQEGEKVWSITFASVVLDSEFEKLLVVVTKTHESSTVEVWPMMDLMGEKLYFVHEQFVGRRGTVTVNFTRQLENDFMVYLFGI